MTDKNILMKKRNADNTDWEVIYPITKASNVLDSDGTSIEEKFAETPSNEAVENALKTKATKATNEKDAIKGQVLKANGDGTFKFEAEKADALNAKGDILYHDGNGYKKLPGGVEGQGLVMEGGLPRWGSSSGKVVTGAYIGNGGWNNIDIGFTPILVLILGINDGRYTDYRLYGDIAFFHQGGSIFNLTSLLRKQSNGFRVEGNNGFDPNTSGVKFNYIAIG